MLENTVGVVLNHFKPIDQVSDTSLPPQLINFGWKRLRTLVEIKGIRSLVEISSALSEGKSDEGEGVRSSLCDGN